MNSKQSLHASFLAFLCLFGSATGSWIGSSPRTEAAVPAPSPPMILPPDPLPLLGELVEEVRALRRELALTPDTRTPAASGEARDSEAAPIQERLSALLGALEAQSASLSSTVSLAQLANSADPRAKDSFLPEAIPGKGLPEDFDRGARESELSQQHQLWSLREVIAKYGQPLRMTDGVLVYGFDEDDVVFNFAQGFVIQVQIQ